MTLVRMKEKIEVLNGERGDKSKRALRFGEAQNLGGDGGAKLSKVEERLAAQIEDLRVNKLNRTDTAVRALQADSAGRATSASKADSADYATAAGNSARVGGFLPGELRQGPFCVQGGTAQAIELTPSGPIGVNLAHGDVYRFMPTFTNNEWSTLKVGTFIPFQMFTADGKHMPAGYLRVGVLTVATVDIYSGAFVISREIERGKNANGSWVRFADGTVEVTHRLVTADDVPAGDVLTIDWPFPVRVTDARMSAFPVIASESGAFSVLGGSSTASAAKVIVKNGSTAQPLALDVRATGTWY